MMQIRRVGYIGHQSTEKTVIEDTVDKLLDREAHLVHQALVDLLVKPLPAMYVRRYRNAKVGTHIRNEMLNFFKDILTILLTK